MTKKYSKVLCTVLAVAMLVGVQIPLANAASVSFTDVPASHWAYAAVTTCVEKGIVSGMGDNKYMPDSNLTRAQFVTMLVNAFYKDEQASYERSNVTKIDQYYDGNTPWWGYYAHFFSNKGLNKGTNNNAASISMMNSSIDRYDMAQLVANILNDKSFTVSESDKANARGRITDWTNVPAKYQDAVSTSFGLGILNGFEDGSFGGTSYLTRAQACVVMVKLDDVLTNGTKTPSTPSTPTVPETPPTSTGDIKVTESNGAYTVADNGFGTGYLNNGKPITEANVLALLTNAQKIWPEGTSWGDHTMSNNHWYETQGNVVQNALTAKYGTSTNYACGGFVAMVSDYLFGKNNNPVHLVTDPTAIRAGDIIVQLINGKVTHVSLAATSAIKGGDFDGRVWLADGNGSVNPTISWPDYEYGMPTSEWLNAYFTPGLTWEVWSRYPSGGTTAPGSVAPNPPASTGEIKVTESNGAYTVADNGFGTGTLNNGLPITEANVLDLLEKAEGHWPNGLKWAERTETNNHWYETQGSVVQNALTTKYGTSTNYACGGYAAMISDYLFGKNNNPVHQVTNINDIRPGDIVVEFSNGKVDHVIVATSSTIRDGAFAGRFWYTNGNVSDKVRWSSSDNESWSEAVNKYYDPTYIWEAWSRYPA